MNPAPPVTRSRIERPAYPGHLVALGCARGGQASPWCGNARKSQQSTAQRSAAQASTHRWGASAQIRSTRWAFGTTRRLSKLAAHSVGMPSSRPSRSSVGMFRTVRVTGAANTPLSTGIAAGRVITRKGRRPSPSISPHHTSRWRGSLTRALRRWRPGATPGQRRPRPPRGDPPVPVDDRLVVELVALESRNHLDPQRGPLPHGSRTPRSAMKRSSSLSRASGSRTAICSDFILQAYQSGIAFGMR